MPLSYSCRANFHTDSFLLFYDCLKRDEGTGTLYTSAFQGHSLNSHSGTEWYNFFHIVLFFIGSAFASHKPQMAVLKI